MYGLSIYLSIYLTTIYSRNHNLFKKYLLYPIMTHLIVNIYLVLIYPTTSSVIIISLVMTYLA